MHLLLVPGSNCHELTVTNVLIMRWPWCKFLWV